MEVPRRNEDNPHKWCAVRCNMNFLDWKREHFIRKTLRKLSRQRVVSVFQPGNIWVIEKSPVIDKKVEAALRTCHLRGWVEPIFDAIPRGQLTKEGKLPDKLSGLGPMYRLTEAGWNALHRISGWIIATWLIAFVTLIATIIFFIVSSGRVNQ
jgi:hypothetical protein